MGCISILYRSGAREKAAFWFTGPIAGYVVAGPPFSHVAARAEFSRGDPAVMAKLAPMLIKPFVV